ncbi:MAG: hypothetical protein M3Z23_02470, partial [Acidobacteriota bacterium]|nr:hypothetical protein [Acidobacteriota bacterium]
MSVSGTTATQAIITYTAPDHAACALEVSESSGFAPLVYDVDPSKFSGANLDNRPGNVTNADGRERTFVVGKRAAEPALDSKKYSRALQAYTKHYFRVTCPSTGDKAAGSFTTKNIQLGNTYADPLPVDKNNPGEYAWPTLSYSDRSEKHVDPLTGALIRRVTLPQDRYLNWPQNAQADAVGFTMARSTGWTSKDAALSNTDGNAAATISGSNTATLYLSAKDTAFWFSGSRFLIYASYITNQYSLNYFQTTLTASTSQAVCNSNGTDDCKIVVCLTVDGVNCYVGGKQFEQALTTTPSDYTFGSTQVDLWQNQGVRPPNGPEVATRTGTITCDGSNTVTRNTGDYFNTLWSSGSVLTVSGTDYPIAAVNGLSSITLASACPAGTGLAYQGNNFGVLVRKKTASADVTSVQYAKVRYQISYVPFISYSGAFDICGPTAVTGPTGNPGYNCAINQYAAIYWIDGTTGESHLIARDLGPAGCGGFDSVIFDAVDPDVFYCGGATPNKIKYVGNHSEPMSTAIPGGFQEGEQLPNCNGTAQAATNQPCVIFTNMVPGTTLPALVNQFEPSFQMDRFNNENFVGVENGHLVYRFWRGNSNSIGWTAVFDPNATSNGEQGNAGCVGGGKPGCVIATHASWKSPKARWCTLKSNSPLFTPGWLEEGPYFGGQLGETAPGRGPFTSTVTDGTAFSTVMGAPGGPTDCPANTMGATGKHCTTVTVDGEPRDLSPCVTSAAACQGAVESGLPGEFGNAALGDYFSDRSDFSGEWMRLIHKNGNSWTFQRQYVGNTVAATPANPILYAICNSIPATHPLPGAAATEWFWNYTADPHAANTTGNTILNDSYSVSAHYYWQNLTSAAPYWIDSTRCHVSGDAGCYQTRTGPDIPTILTTPPTALPSFNPAFAGKRGSAQGDNTQSHPTGVGLQAPSADKEYFLDGRPFNGGPLSGSSDGIGMGNSPGTQPFGGQLWKFTRGQIPALDRKFVPTMAIVGRMTLKDISSPATGDAIGTGAADSYKYCVAFLANECRAGSAPGDVYVNAPYVAKPYCTSPGQATPGSDDFDVCIGNNAMVYNSVMEVGLKYDDRPRLALGNEPNGGKFQRVLTNGFARNRLPSIFWHPNALANARWLLIDSPYGADGFRPEIFVVKVPTPQTDSVDRSNFFPVNVPTAAVPGGDNAVVEFGYGENGDAGNYFCTSRAEACAVGKPGGAANPFYYLTSEAAALTGVPCSSGCTITVQAIPQRVLYGRILYRNAGGTVVAR